MTKSGHVRIDCKLIIIVDSIVKKNPMFGNRRKFIELAVLEKIGDFRGKKK